MKQLDEIASGRNGAAGNLNVSMWMPMHESAVSLHRRDHPGHDIVATKQASGFGLEARPGTAAEILYPNSKDNFEEWKLTGADRAYHYLGSAIWFTRIGKSGGDAMIELQQPWPKGSVEISWRHRPRVHVPCLNTPGT